MKQSPNIGFIVGMGRSGTTLIAALLNRHPEICVLPETGFFVHMKSLPGGSQSLKEEWPVSMQTLANKMRRNATPSWNPQETAHLLIEKHPRFPGVRPLFQDFCTMIAHTCGKTKTTWILEKTPDHMLCHEEIQKNFPKAPLLHIIRDGRAVAESRSRMTFLSPEMRDLEFNTLQWAWRMWKIRPCLSHHDRYLEFRYESLVQHPEATLHTILEFLRLDYHPNLLHPQGNEDHLIETGMHHKDGIKRPIDPQLTEAWREKLPPEKQKRLEHLAGQQLHELGYPLHHIHPKQARTALLPERFVTHPRLLKQFKDEITDYLIQNGAVVSGTYSHLDTAPAIQDIYALDPIEPSRIRQLGALPYLWRILRLVLSLKRHGKHLHLLNPKRQYDFRDWPLGHLLESLLHTISHA